MFRILFIITFLLSTLFASLSELDKKINLNQDIYDNVIKDKSNIDKNINELAQSIQKNEATYEDILEKLNEANEKIISNKLKLEKSKKEIAIFEKKAIDLKKKKEYIEEHVIKYIIDKYAMSIGLKHLNKESLDDIINREVYSLILENAKEEVFNLNINYIKVNQDTRKNKNKISKLNIYIQNQLKIKKEYLDMEEKEKNIISSLKNKHKSYQDNLKNLIKKQNKVSELLANLSILKSTSLKKETNNTRRKKRLERERLARQKKINQRKERERKKRLARLAKLTEENIRKRAKLNHKKITKKELKNKVEKETKEIKFISKKKLDDDINLKVKKIGSSTKGVKISKYYGKKTIAPLKNYTIVKKFGKYYDSVYKIELFNESISLKAKKTNSKVYNVFNGEIVYAKNNSGLLANVVIVKHSKGLHTIYSHLDKISPTLKVGKWIKKGYVVGRVNNILQFQATKNNKYIDPEKLFRK